MPVKIPQDDVYRRRLLERSQPAENGCRLWTGAKKPAGYGNVSFRGRVVGAHTAAYAVFRGPIPAGLWVLHRCDTPACIEPAHLFLGTAKENTRDMCSKGRDFKHQKLSNDQMKAVISERRAGAALRDLATRFDVSQALISNLCKGKKVPRSFAAYAVTELHVTFEEPPP